MTVLDELWQEIDATVKTEGFKIEILDGKVVMSPQSPEQDWTTDDIKAAALRAGIARDRLVRDVAIDFPGETSSAPDVAVNRRDRDTPSVPRFRMASLWM